MKETVLWTNVKQPLAKIGKFQKISDRFSQGVPDILGCTFDQKGVALELKELKGIRIIRTSFRPGQLDFLKAWPGPSYILSTHGSVVFLHKPNFGIELEHGMEGFRLLETSSLCWKKIRGNKWSDLEPLFKTRF